MHRSLSSRHHSTTARILALAATAATAVALTACSSGASDSPSSSSSSASTKSYTVGVFVVAQADLLDEVVKKFEAAVTSGIGDAKVTFDEKNANGDQSLITSLARDFAGSEDDAFAVIGTPAVIALAGQVTDRPVFALAMGDPVGAGLAKTLDAPGGNVTGSIDYIDPAKLLPDITQIQPGVKTIGTVYDPSNQNMQVWVKGLKAATAKAGLKLAEATISGSADVSQSARSLNGRADAILIGPDATVIAGMDAVGAVATGGSIPLYVAAGDASVAGVLASIGPDYDELGTSAGVNAAKVLLGADPATTPFTTPQGLELTINGKTKDALGITVPDALLKTATVL